MISETFSTLDVISKKLKVNTNSNFITSHSRTRKIKFNGETLYNENDISNAFIQKDKYLYIRLDSEDQIELRDKYIEEFKSRFTDDYNIIIGVSPLNNINNSLIFLLNLCMRKRIEEVIFYSKTNSISPEILQLIILFAKTNGVTLTYYKND